MKRPLTFLISVCVGVLAFLVMGPAHVRVLAQNRMTFSLVAQDTGHIALGLALRKLNVSGTFMQAPAHPDDENNPLLALFAHGMGLRTVDVQNNRGDGGQNRNRSGVVPRHRRPAHVRETALGASALMARSSISRARDRLRLLFRSPGSNREMGTRGHCRRLCPADPHPPPRCGAHNEYPGPRRRPRA